MLLDPQLGATGEGTEMINKEVISKHQGSNSAAVPEFVLDWEVGVMSNSPCGWELGSTLGCKASIGKKKVK